MMVGREVNDLYPRSARRDDGEVVLEVRALAGAEKPHSASLTLRRGRVLGIAGLMGAGRTELHAGDFRSGARGERRNPRGNVFRCLRSKTALGAGRRHGQRRSQTGRARAWG